MDDTRPVGGTPADRERLLALLGDGSAAEIACLGAALARAAPMSHDPAPPLETP